MVANGASVVNVLQLRYTEAMILSFLAALLSVSNLLVWLPPLWRNHTRTAYGAIIAELAALIVFIYMSPGLWALLFLGASIYKIVNAARLIYNRTQEKYLRRVSVRSAFILSLLQVALCLLAPFVTNTLPLVWAVVIAQLVAAGILFTSTSRHLKTTKTLQVTTSYTDAELPSLSVLIPARNETDDLYACLKALVASNYPKLEIIVLDDNSQNRRTPEIIREFAHDGVRFIQGEEPTDNWLAKNFAYQQLADAASGDYLLFCGVDLRVTEGALRELITTMLEKKKTMLSILPQNAMPQDFRSYLLQPMRYAWEISLPRRLFSRPAVLSTCWIITREALLSSGNFKATSRSILPESHFARTTSRVDGYSFLRSNLLVSSKPVLEQRATAIRMRYPQLHRHLELVGLLTAVELLAVVLPLPLAFVLYTTNHTILGSLSVLAFAVGYIVYLQVTGVMYGRPVLWGVLMAPLTAFYDITMLNFSMYKYEFGQVIWKERDISTPIMRFDEPAPALAVAPQAVTTTRHSSR